MLKQYLPSSTAVLSSLFHVLSSSLSRLCEVRPFSTNHKTRGLLLSQLFFLNTIITQHMRCPLGKPLIINTTQQTTATNKGQWTQTHTTFNTCALQSGCRRSLSLSFPWPL